MESIVDICEDLVNSSIEECQIILDNPQDPMSETFSMHLDKTILEQLLSGVKKLKVDDSNDNVKVLKKVSAYAIFNALHASTIEVKLLASRLLVITSSLPTASAFGVSNSNVIQSLLGTLNKYFASELKGSTKGTSSDSKSSNTLSMNIQLHGDETETGDSENVKTTKGARSSKRLQSTQDSDDEHSDADLGDGENLFEESKSQQPTRSSSAKVLKDKLKSQQLAAFLADISVCIDLLANQSDEYVLNIGAELLMTIQFLCTVKPEFAGSAVPSQKSLVSFGTKCKAALITTYRALMPTLTMAHRNPLLPDDAKVKRACHKAALNVVLDLMKASCQAPHLTIVEVTETEEIADDTHMKPSSVSNSPRSPGSPATPGSPVDGRRSSTGSTGSAKSVVPTPAAVMLPLAHTCLIGVLQRISLSPPDRAPIRQLLLTSLVDMISVLGKDLPASAACATPEQLLPVLLSIEHFLVFLSKLAKSSKVAHRAFSLDIAAQLLSTTWLWDLQSSVALAPTTAASEMVPPSTVLLEVLQDRCLDCSPAVRTRALTAIHELLLNLNDDSAPAMMRALLDAVMAAKPPRSSNSSDTETAAAPRLSLLDMLRERATDDRPQVRTKALQAFGLALSMPWPKPSHQQEDPSASRRCLDHVNMLIMDDDLEVFASHCRDASLSVRKQAMLSLTELLTARPADALIQDMWIQAVIPMTFDAESSVANKVAESLHTLLFDNLVAWYQDQQDRSRGPSSRTGSSFATSTATASAGRDLERQEYISLVWRLSGKVTAMGMFKILKSVLGIMLKQGLMNANPIGKNEVKSSSLLSVITALKYACCYHIGGSDVQPIEDASSQQLQQSAMLSTMQNIRSCEPEEVARGAWILLEGLVSLEQMSILNAKQESIKFREFFRQVGSADFVVRCYRQKHAAQNTTEVVWDEEDLRIFKVLEIMGASLSDEDAAYVKQQLVRNLQQMQCECHIAAAAIAVMLQLSKASVQDALITATDPLKVMVSAVTVWTAPLLVAVNTVLHTYTFGTRPVAAGAGSADSSSAVGNLLQDWLNDSFKTDTSMTFDVSMSVDHSAHLTSSVLDTVQVALFILGEIAMLGFSMEEDHFVANQNQKKQSAAATNNSAARSAENFKLVIGESLVDLVKILMGHSLPLAGEIQRECPNKIRANAFVAMGKLCMRNKTLARSNVNIFLREVSSSSSNPVSASAEVSTLTMEVSHNRSTLSAASSVAAAAAVRSNALLVLGDMCVRYTNLVDRHVDTMAQCLQDSDSLVRKNALILLTQLLLQDFLKWKGFLLYRFLVLTVDADHEIAEFSRNILQKTLSLKYPQLLTNHFTEALVILNACTAHPAYSSIARTGTSASDGAFNSLPADGAGINSSQQMDTEVDEEAAPVEVSFTCSLSKAQRFGVYAFMAENMDDETKIQVSAKLVQDILSAAVDSSSLLPQPGNKGSRKNDREKYTAFEAVLEDALTLMRTPHLKVGQKKGGADDGDDAAEDDTAGADAGGNNAKAAFVRAKSKVLKKLSTQHLVSHTLPVIISLKHVLEATKSPLQGTLMEFLVSLVKNHKNEVEEALQFDPTLRSEIEYDLKQFERAKKDKLTAAITAFSAKKAGGTRTAPGTMQQSARKPLSPFLDLQQIPSRSIVKPSLRKSLGGEASRGRTPYDALKSPGMHLARSAIRSVLAGTAASRSVRLAAAADDDDRNNDDVDRLTFSQAEAGAAYPAVPDFVVDESDHAIEMQDVAHTAQVLFANDDVSDRAAVSGVHSSHKQSRRRSWGVVVDSLLPTGSATYPASETNNTSLGSTTASTGSPSKDKERSSPPKKKRCRKSTTPAKSSSKEVSFQQLLTQEEATAAAGGGGDHVHAENRAPAQNIWNVASMRPIAGSSAGDQPLKPVMSRVGGGARTAGGGALLATLAAPPAAASVIAQDAAVNAFDRLLANASVPKLVQRGAPVGDASGKGSRQGKRGATQQNSLLGLF